MARLRKQLRLAAHYLKTGEDTTYKLIELWEKIKDITFYSWYYPITKFVDNCVRLLKWAPIIWKDRDWDYYHIYQIFKCKLKFTREYLQKYGHSAEKDIDIKNIRIAELLIERIQKNEYATKDYDEYFDNYISILDTIMKTDTSNKVAEDKNSKKLFLNIVEKEKYLREYDKQYLFKHLQKYLHKWWD